MNIDKPKDSHIGGLRELWKEAFGDGDEFLDMFFETGFSPDRCRCVTDGDSVVGGLYWFDCECRGKPIAYIYAVATLRNYRGQGVCSLLMENTHSHLKKCGYDGAILVPSDEGLFDFYARFGYETCSYIKSVSCSASGEKTEIRRISHEEYAMLRRRFLPRGGVIQENENIRFLEGMNELCAGNDFVFAVPNAYLSPTADKSRTLKVTEFLGSEEMCGTVTGSLGYENGVFRCPGNEREFAMYLSFGDKKTPPEYFGLAYD